MVGSLGLERFHSRCQSENRKYQQEKVSSHRVQVNQPQHTGPTQSCHATLALWHVSESHRLDRLASTQKPPCHKSSFCQPAQTLGCRLRSSGDPP